MVVKRRVCLPPQSVNDHENKLVKLSFRWFSILQLSVFCEARNEGLIGEESTRKDKASDGNEGICKEEPRSMGGEV